MKTCGAGSEEQASNSPRPRVLADFEGRWQVRRNIEPQAGPSVRFLGEARWRPCAKGLDYVELGQMTIAGQTPLQAERRYLWTEDLSVHFEDGRFFHKVPPLGGETRHWCAPDDYRLSYDFTGWPVFRVSWHVNGPRKNYSAETEYRRI